MGQTLYDFAGGKAGNVVIIGTSGANPPEAQEVLKAGGLEPENTGSKPEGLHF